MVFLYLFDNKKDLMTILVIVFIKVILIKAAMKMLMDILHIKMINIEG